MCICGCDRGKSERVELLEICSYRIIFYRGPPRPKRHTSFHHLFVLAVKALVKLFFCASVSILDFLNDLFSLSFLL